MIIRLKLVDEREHSLNFRHKSEIDFITKSLHVLWT